MDSPLRRGSPIIPINLELWEQWAQVATESLRTHDQKNYMVWIPRPPFSGDSGSNTVSLRLTVPISQKKRQKTCVLGTWRDKRRLEELLVCGIFLSTIEILFRFLVWPVLYKCTTPPVCQWYLLYQSPLFFMSLCLLVGMSLSLSVHLSLCLYISMSLWHRCLSRV